MRLHIDFTALKKDISSLEKQSVTVGVLTLNKKSNKIDWSKGLTTISSADINQGVNSIGMQQVNRRYVQRKGSKFKNPSMRELAYYLDKKKGIFSNVLVNPNNADLKRVAQDLAVVNKTAQDVFRLENASQALVRNPILRGDYNPNSSAWAKRKGFNHWGIATGTIFKNITAAYKSW